MALVSAARGLGRTAYVLGAAFVLAASSISALPLKSLVFADGAYQLTGRITDPGGSGIANVSVSATAPGGSAIQFGPASSGADGTYSLGIDAGTYDIHFDPPASSGLHALVQSNVTITGSQTLNVQVASSLRSFSATVRDAAGGPVPAMHVTFTGTDSPQVTGTTDTNGHISFTSLPADRYNFQGTLMTGAGTYDLPQGVSINLINNDFSDDIVLPFKQTAATITVHAKDPQGNPVASAQVNLPFSTISFTTANSESSSIMRYQGAQLTTDAGGSATTTVYGGFTLASVCGSTTAGAQGCTQANVTTDADRTIDVTLVPPQAHKFFSTTVRDAAGAPIPGLHISMFVVDGPEVTGTTDEAGHLRIDDLPAGNYVFSATLPTPEGTYTIPQQHGVDMTTNDFTSDIVLPIVAEHDILTAHVRTPAGAPIAGASVVFSANKIAAITPADGSLSFDIFPPNTPALNTDSAGNISRVLYRNFTYNANSICATSPNGAIGCNDTALGSDATDVTIVVDSQTTHSFSTTLTDAAGAPVKNVTLYLDGVDTPRVTGITDNNGHVTIAGITPSMYALSANIPGSPNGYTMPQQGGIDLRDQDFNKNIQLPFTASTAKITVSVKDPYGAALANAQVAISLTPLQFTIPGDAIVRSVAAQGTTHTTGADGTVSADYYKGFAYGACVTFPDNTQSCNSPNDVLSGDATIVFTQTMPPPSAPTNLSATSPTLAAPALTWNAVAGATSYKIYRDSTLAGTSTTASYTDNAAAEGSHNYVVTAVRAGAESGPSNMVTVVLDKTRPNVSFTSPASFAGPFTTGPLVTVVASDPGSGLKNLVIHVYTSTNQLLTTCGSATPTQLAAGSMSCSLSALPNGTYYIKAGSFDNAGNNRTITSSNFVISH